MSWIVFALLAFGVSLAEPPGGEPPAQFQAGAATVDVSPTNFPVIVNCMFEERTGGHVHDPLYARTLVLDDGNTRIAMVVVDNCMMPRELLDRAKELASKVTGIATGHMLISATHTHSAPAAMGCLGSSADADYPRFLESRIAKAIELAVKNLAPARIGWAVVQDFEHTYCRRWIRRPDRIDQDPFGGRTVRANMHPGYQNPDVIGPSGPVDPDLSVLSLQSSQGRPIAVLANYSMHYFGSPLLSADYFGRFAEKIRTLISAGPDFVGIMSQGTSGDLMWMDYGQPKPQTDLESYSDAVARSAYEAFKKIEYREWVPLAMRETSLTLSRRLPDAERLAWARNMVAGLQGQKPRARPEIYAREQIFLSEEPQRELKVQAIRIGDLGITAIPNEVFGITGLKIKAQSPLPTTFNIELANGSEGYIPPPEQHRLGGYTTWPARTAALEVQAEPKIVEAVITLLEQVAGRPRQSPKTGGGHYVEAVLKSKPLALWRMEEFTGPTAVDALGRHPAHYQDGIAFYLPGPESPGFAKDKSINRAAHLAGGRITASVRNLRAAFSIEMWFWNGLPSDARPVTGYLFSLGRQQDAYQLGIGGHYFGRGRLVFTRRRNAVEQAAHGASQIEPKSWTHIVFVRSENQVLVYLNGNLKPEIVRSLGPEDLTSSDLFIGGREDEFASFEGKIDEVSLYNRALTPEEISAHYLAAGGGR